MSTPLAHGGPAFPVSTTTDKDFGFGHQDSGSTWQFPGMTMRQVYAGQAMQAMITGQIAHHGHENHWAYADLASEAVQMADALLKALDA